MQTQQEPLTDAQYSFILEAINDTRKRKYDLKLIIEAVFWLNRTGCQWRNLSKEFPDWRIVYYYFRRFKFQGLWEKISLALVIYDRQQNGKTDTPSLVMIDSQSVKTVQFVSQETGIDGNKKINGRKRQAVVDTSGNIWCIFIHAANYYDGIKGIPTWDKFTDNVTTVKKILADGTYKGQFSDHVKEAGCEIEISSRPPTERGFVPVSKRWIVERTFSWFNYFRRLDKEYEKTIQSSEVMIYIAQIQLILNRNFKIAK